LSDGGLTIWTAVLVLAVGVAVMGAVAMITRW
jgi:hypothetical protein